MFKVLKKSKKSIQKLVQSGWVMRIVMILAAISLIDLLINASFHKLIITGIFLLAFYGISKVFKSARKLWYKGVRYFKRLNVVNKIMVFLATNSTVDLVTSAAFYKLLFVGFVGYFIFRIIKNTMLFTLVSSLIKKVVKVFRRQTA